MRCWLIVLMLLATCTAVGAADSVVCNGTYLTTHNNPMVTFTMDDGWAEDYTVIKPVFDSKGIVGTSWMIAEKVNQANYMTTAQLLALQSAGWEIGSHLVTHTYLDLLSDAAQKTQLSDSKTTLEALGLTINNMAYPYGTYSDAAASNVLLYYRSGRAIYEKPNAFPLYNRGALGAISIDNIAANLATHKAQVDLAIVNSSWLIFYFHSQGKSGTFTTPLTELIDYIQSKNVPIVTINGALNR